MREKKKIVIIEDNYEHNKRVSEHVINVLKRNNHTDYVIVSMQNYNDELNQIIHDTSIKIFLIDLVLGIGPNSTDGYEICEIIRNDANDWNSPIIIMSIHEFQKEIISERLSILTYIYKNDKNFDEKIKSAIEKSCNIIENNHLFEINSFTKVATSEICYVKKEKDSKYCSVITFYGEYRKRDALKNINNLLHFKQLNDHLLINEKNVIFMSRELIIFKNNIQINPSI